MTLNLRGLSPRKQLPQYNHRKNSRQFLCEGHSTKHLIYTPQNRQGHQKQGKSEELSQPRGA